MDDDNDQPKVWNTMFIFFCELHKASIQYLAGSNPTTHIKTKHAYTHQEKPYTGSETQSAMEEQHKMSPRALSAKAKTLSRYTKYEYEAMRSSMNRNSQALDLRP